jgi:AcrR family transcriptional regulator
MDGEVVDGMRIVDSTLRTSATSKPLASFAASRLSFLEVLKHAEANMTGDRKLGIAERKGRERAEREQRIISAARAIAEREWWDAVTVRRLADEIEYSEPVLYSHFENRDAIVAAAAAEGFQEITVALREAAKGSTGRSALRNVAMAYLAFALSRPALYEAMFTLSTDLRFAEAATRPELRAAFEAVAAVVGPFCVDVEVATETFGRPFTG